jgi:predicted nucleic acid-binding protein
VSLVVSDTTPLNYLILIGHVHVLPRLFGRILIPPAVIGEMRHVRSPATVAAWTDNLPTWAEIRAPEIDLDLRIGRGEDEAISLAAELGGAALLETRGILTIGTLTILDLADEMELLDFEQAISLLLATNFHVEDALIRRLRAKIRARKGS